MSRFGWAYVNDIVTGSGGTPGGSDKQIQFNSGSAFSGSTNLTFDYNTNTLRLTGSLYADNLIVSSSTIYTSGSTKFGDDNSDTHQFTGSVYTTGIVSSSNDIYTNASLQVKNNITSTTGVVSSSLGFLTSGSVQSVGNITSTNGSISSSVALNTAGTLGVGQSATIGTGLTILTNGFHVTGSSFVTGVLSASFVQSDGFEGSGVQLTGIQASNVDGAGDDWSLQIKSGDTGTITGSSNLKFNNNILSASAVSASTWYGLPTTSTNPGGTNTSIQFNSGSTFSGSSNLTYNYTSNLLAVTGTVGLYAGNLDFTGNSVVFEFAEDEQFLIRNSGGGNLLNLTSPVSGRNQITIGNLDAAKDTTVTIQGIGDDYLNITIPTSGTIAQFTTISGSTITGSTGLFTTLTSSTVTGTIARFTSITGSLFGTASYSSNSDLLDGRDSATFASTGSNTFIGNQIITGTLSISGNIDSRGIPFASSLTSMRRTIQVFPGAGSMANSMNPIDNANNTPFTQAGTATQAFSNGYAIIGYSVASSTSTYGITTPDVGTTKVLCTSQRGPSWKGNFRTGNDLTSTRVFVGFEEYPGQKDADDPTNAYAHINYSSVRGDTTFKIIARTANGVGTQAIIDTGISASTSTNYYFDMKLGSGSFDVTLTSGSTTYVGSITSSLPNITASLGTCAAAKNTSAVSRTFSIYYLEFNDS